MNVNRSARSVRIADFRTAAVPSEAAEKLTFRLCTRGRRELIHRSNQTSRCVRHVVHHNKTGPTKDRSGSKPAVSSMPALGLLLRSNQTLMAQVGMWCACQEETYAMQQIAFYSIISSASA